MFNARVVVIEAFIKHLQALYRATFGDMAPSYTGIIAFVGRMVLENIARSDAPYHGLEHTIMVTLVGQEIIRAKHLSEGRISPRCWTNFIVSLLCHDIGYVRGVCSADRPGHYVIDEQGNIMTVKRGATDASLTPHHVDRGKIFIRERLVNHSDLDAHVIMANIEHTRFPVPASGDYKSTDDEPGLVRAADLIGQMADPHYIAKLSSLFSEFEETGENRRLGYETAADLRDGYPKFYWRMVSPYIQDAIRYLKLTQEGQQWVANLYNHVFAEEHHLISTAGPERGDDA
ncbi:MAG: metal-dependent phosphohydrolase [Candidatus Competibacterales bacterium]